MATAAQTLEEDTAEAPSALAEAEANRAFAGEVQGFCQRMLNSPVAKKAQAAARRAQGSDTICREEENVLKQLEERAASKKVKASASTAVLKDRFEKRQLRSASSPEDASKKKNPTADGSKKTKKKKV